MDKKPEHPGTFLWVLALIGGAVAIGLFAVAKWMYPYSGWLLFGILGGFATIFAGGAIFSHMSRSVSVAATGFASSKIGKQYECTNCKHKW